MGDKQCSSREKGPEIETNHSPWSSTEVKNKRSYTSAVIIRLLDTCLKFPKKIFARNICEETDV
jgi:hypothetical protein